MKKNSWRRYLNESNGKSQCRRNQNRRRKLCFSGRQNRCINIGERNARHNPKDRRRASRDVRRWAKEHVEKRRKKRWIQSINWLHTRQVSISHSFKNINPIIQLFFFGFNRRTLRHKHYTGNQTGSQIIQKIRAPRVDGKPSKEWKRIANKIAECRKTLKRFGIFVGIPSKIIW